MAAKKKLPPIHPGVILREDLDDAGVSLNRLARDIRVPMNRISAIVNRKRSITADTALRLAAFFGTSPQYWMNLQANYDIARAEHQAGGRIRGDVRAFRVGPVAA
jgi:addiction module HigA family antidote